MTLLRSLLMLLWLAAMYLASGLSPSSSRHAATLSLTALTKGAKRSDKKLSDNLIRSLDLVPLLDSVANHAGTRRGRQALLSLVGEAESQQRLLQKHFPSDGQAVSSRRQMMDSLAREGGSDSTTVVEDTYEEVPDIVSVAASLTEAQEEYKMTEQAMLALHNTNGAAYPPLYGADSSPWDTAIVDTDFDGWLTLPIDEWTLEHVLQADQMYVLHE